MKKETSNKILLGLVSFIFLTSILSYVVLAAETVDPNAIRETTKNSIQTAFAPIMGVVSGILEIIFGAQWLNATRFFLFVLLTLIIWSIIPLILGDKGKALNFWISLIIAIIAIMAIPPELLDALVANYGAMGAAMLTVIPFAIILVFSVRVQNAILARLVWIFYCIYYFGLYIYKITSVAATGTGTAAGYTFYVLAIFGGIIMFFVIGGIRNLLWYGEMDAIKETGKQLIEEESLLGKLNRKRLKRSYGDATNG
ncbi:hypothetical protein J4218_04805 [Candidatus Pacearchaeota archaeon]|nr:hypothetical protein [Candidatus Pacearchaeota archaeon]